MDNLAGIIATIITIAIMGAIVFGAIMIIEGINSFFANRQYEIDEANTHCERIELVSLNVGSKIAGNIKGDFFLIFGSLSGEFGSSLAYNFYAKKDDGSYVLNQRPATTPIFEDEKENPYLLECGPNRPKVEFHIPAGSIISNYELAL